jgi:hypothetical protein
MANWDKLNEELDSTLDSMTQEDWIKWKNKNKMGIYRKKPVEIEAVQYDGNFRCLDIFNIHDVKDFKLGKESDGSPYLLIPTLEGDMKCSKGDYVIRGVKGEYYPCKPDIFELTYEMVEKTNENDKI